MSNFTDDDEGRHLREAAEHLREISGGDYHEVENPQLKVAAYEGMVLVVFMEDGHPSRIMGVNSVTAYQLAEDLLTAAVVAKQHLNLIAAAEAAETAEIVEGVSDLLKSPPQTEEEPS